MLSIVDLYNQNTEKFIDALSKEIELICIKGGTKVQIIYDNDSQSIKFYNGDLYNTEIGNEIKHIDKLFTKGLKNAIDNLLSKESIIKQYKYILVEIYDNNIYLISVIDKNLNINKDIYKIAKSLNIKLFEQSFKGKLNKRQLDLIISLLNGNTFLGKTEFNGFIKELFNIDETKQISFNDLLFNLNYDKSHVQAIFSCSSERCDLDKTNPKKLQNKDVVLKLKECFEGYSTDDDFINLMNDPKQYNKLYNIGINLLNNDVNICLEALDERIKNIIKSKGKIVERLYENYVIINYINEKIKIENDDINNDEITIYTSHYHPEKIMDALDNFYGRRNHNISIDFHNFKKVDNEYISSLTYETDEDLIKLCAFIELLFGISMYNGEKNNSEDIGHYIHNKDIIKYIGNKYQTEIDDLIQKSDDTWLEVYNEILK